MPTVCTNVHLIAELDQLNLAPGGLVGLEPSDGVGQVHRQLVDVEDGVLG